MNTTDNHIAAKSNAALPTVSAIKRIRFPSQPQEWKIASLRECPTPEELHWCDTPERAAAYWNLHIVQHPYFNPECECLVALILNSKLKVKGHYLITTGLLNQTLVHAREVYRLAIVASAASIVLMHNHPSGDATPSSDDLRATRELVQAGQVIGIHLLDHVIMGNPNHTSLKSLGLIS